jgi:tellurite resistance protein TerC
VAENSYSALRTARRWIVAVVGVTIAAIGLALLVLPGPGLLVIAVGIGLLGTEFAWARRLLKRVRAQLPGSDDTDTRTDSHDTDDD